MTVNEYIVVLWELYYLTIVTKSCHSRIGRSNTRVHIYGFLVKIMEYEQS